MTKVTLTAAVRAACGGRADERFLRLMIARGLEMGFTASIWDGEEWSLRRSTDAKAIVAALATVDEDILEWEFKDKTRFVKVYLVYGNEDGVLVNDCFGISDGMAWIEGIQAECEELIK